MTDLSNRIAVPDLEVGYTVTGLIHAFTNVM